MRENKIPRRIIILIVAVPILLVLLYLGGLLGQLISGYQNWLAQDGMSGGVTMDEIILDPLYCLGKAFTKDGLIGAALIVGITAAIIIFLKLQNKFGSKDLDERNFARSKSGVYGTAGWMTPKEMKSVLEVSSPENAKGVILGKKNGSVICLPVDTRLNKHICVFGTSGTMKSRAIIRPYLFQSIKRGDSVVITDPKGELYSDTAELFRRNGYNVRVFNLVNPEHSDSWNCMADLDGDTMMAQILTNVIISNTGKGKVDHFWDNGEGNLLKSLILYIDQDESRSPEAKHLPAVYQMLTQNTERSLSAIFEKLSISHPAKAPYNLFAQSSDTVRAGIVLGLGTRLQVLQNESIKNILSKSELDLSEPGRTKCAYYVILSDQESSTEFISSLFFSLLFIKLARYADSMPSQRCKVPVNIVFDEFNNVGQLDTYPRRLSVVRSRAIQVCHVVQSLAQFKNRYPDEQWAEIVGNCDTQIMLGCTEELTAEYFSARSGDMTVDVNSTMTVKQTIAIAQMIPQYRHTEGMGKRRLMTPDEVFRIPNTEMLIIVRGEKVLRAEKFDFTGHPYAKKMVVSSVLDYCPLEKKPIRKTKEPEIIKTDSEALPKPPLPQTGNKKGKNKGIPVGGDVPPEEIRDSCQTETETDPEIGIEKLPDESGGKNTDDSDITGAAPHKTSQENTVQSPEISAEHQTDAGVSQKKPSRHAKNPAPALDYSQLLESFKPQPKKNSGKSKRDPPDENDDSVIPDPSETDTGIFPENPSDYQTETQSPLVDAATGVDSLGELSSISAAGRSSGGDQPPDDF